MIDAINGLPRYIACVRHTRRPVFEFIDPAVHPNDALTVFALADDYSFGILQSDVHWRWFKARCSMLKGDWRYTSETVFDSFPWPQNPSAKSVKAVADAGRQLRDVRRSLMAKMGWHLRDLYRTTKVPGSNPLRDAQDALDEAVRQAFAMPVADDPLAFILELNAKVAEAAATGKRVEGPGVPSSIAEAEALISADIGISAPPLNGRAPPARVRTR